MKDAYKTLIDSHWDQLVTRISKFTMNVADSLLSYKAINGDIFEGINDEWKKGDVKEANRFMLRILKTMDDNAFDGLIEALRKIHQNELANMLSSGANLQRSASGSLIQAETPIDYDGVNLNLRMTDNSKKALMSNCDTACDAITEGALAILSTKLKDKGHLTKVDVQEINAQPLLYNKNHKLLAILSTRTERAFVDFIEMLPTVNFGWLADKILQKELTNMLSNEANPQRSPSGLQTQNKAVAIPPLDETLVDSLWKDFKAKFRKIPEEKYPMLKRAKMLIIDNEIWPHHPRANRDGSSVDRRLLEKLSVDLGFGPAKVAENCSVSVWKFLL
uniref:CARD domain-containing protein n=1 Tax=Plectus sambesii TaxID=2011161 RepID=A0A914WRK4_9BILA